MSNEAQDALEVLEKLQKKELNERISATAKALNVSRPVAARLVMHERRLEELEEKVENLDWRVQDKDEETEDE